MKLSRWNKLATTAMAAAVLLTLTGCAESLLRNMWRGFGESLGGVPGDVLADAVSGALGL